MSVAGVGAMPVSDSAAPSGARFHPQLNPTRVVPIGPALDYRAPHGREALADAA